MFFSMTNSLATFQTMMNNIFQEFHNKHSLNTKSMREYNYWIIGAFQTTINLLFTIMKRRQSNSLDTLYLKRLRVAESSELQQTVDSSEWTKVERRKAKKDQKLKAKSDVCVFSYLFTCLWLTCCYPLPPFSSCALLSQMIQPRFMYHNNEINKRSHAVNIDVRSQILRDLV